MEYNETDDYIVVETEDGQWCVIDASEGYPLDSMEDLI